MASLLSLFGFTKRVRRSHRKKRSSKKPSKKTRSMCKKLGVRVTVKRGSKRVYKSEKLLLRQCKKKKAKLAKCLKKRAAKCKGRLHRKLKGKGRKVGRKAVGGPKKALAAPKLRAEDLVGLKGLKVRPGGIAFAAYGRHRKLARFGNRRRASRFGNSSLQPRSLAPMKRLQNPPGYGTVDSRLGVYGVGSNFFGLTQPLNLSPFWNKNIQPDGSSVFVGSPFSAYKDSIMGYE